MQPPSEPIDPIDAALRIAEALEAQGVSYALGGALAYGLWGVPRATNDVVVNVFVQPEERNTLFEALAPLGIALDPARARHEAARDGLIITRYGGFRIALFVPSIDFSWEAERTRVRHTVDARSAFYLAAEAIAVFKMLFFRGKDLVDVERLVAVHESLDKGYVRARLVEMLGEDDDRVRRWDRIVAGGPAVT